MRPDSEIFFSDEHDLVFPIPKILLQGAVGFLGPFCGGVEVTCLSLNNPH